jgi:hypothetical protein
MQFSYSMRGIFESRMIRKRDDSISIRKDERLHVPLTGRRTAAPFYLNLGSNRDPLHLVQRDLIACAIVQLSRARRFVASDDLRVFKCACIA